MSQYDRTNKGVLFDNDRKQTDNHPDMTGSINIDGVEHWFSAWWKDGSRGEFLSLSIGKPKDQQAAPTPAATRGNRPAASSAIQRPSAQRLAAAQQAPSDWDDSDPIPF
jgi:hypothetical protein